MKWFSIPMMLIATVQATVAQPLGVMRFTVKPGETRVMFTRYNYELECRPAEAPFMELWGQPSMGRVVVEKSKNVAVPGSTCGNRPVLGMARVIFTAGPQRGSTEFTIMTYSDTNGETQPTRFLIEIR